VPRRILNKAGKPDPRDWERLKQHPAEGARIAAPLCAWLGGWAVTIVQHHERFDGTGYPAGLARDEISLGARIVAVADSFEVMTAARAYKKPMSVPAARRELARCAGSQFDPDMVRSFLNISIGRLWWMVGPTSWVAVIPVLGSLQRSGAQIAIAVKGAAVVAALGIGGAAQIANASTAPAPASVPPSADATHVVPASSSARVRERIPAPQAPIGTGGGSGSGEVRTTEHQGTGGGSTTTDGGSAGGGEGSTPSSDPVTDAAADTVDAVPGTVDGITDAVDQATGGTTSATSQAIDDVVQTVTGSAGYAVQQTLGSLGL
jgi:hypothetical protein